MYRNEITLAMNRNTEFPCIDTVIKKAEDLQYKDYSVKSLITTLKKAKDTNRKLGNRLFIVELNEDESWVLQDLGYRTESVRASYSESFYPDYGSSYLLDDEDDCDDYDDNEDDYGDYDDNEEDDYDDNEEEDDDDIEDDCDDDDDNEDDCDDYDDNEDDYDDYDEYEEYDDYDYASYCNEECDREMDMGYLEDIKEEYRD